MSLLLLFRPTATSIIPGPAIPGVTLAWREPVTVNYRESADVAYREPAVRTAT